MGSQSAAVADQTILHTGRRRLVGNPGNPPMSLFDQQFRQLKAGQFILEQNTIGCQPDT